MSVEHSSLRSVDSLIHARGAATEKAPSPTRRRVRGMTRFPDDEACNVDRPGGWYFQRLVSVGRKCTPKCVPTETCMDQHQQQFFIRAAGTDFLKFTSTFSQKTPPGGSIDPASACAEACRPI